MPPLDPLYVLARSVLLDALSAIGDQRGSAILVGAQAVYLHTGAADLAVAEYTTDADLAVDPRDLKSRPLLQQALEAAQFRIDPSQVGRWSTSRKLDERNVDVVVDLMVPAALAGDGRRAARLGEHGERTARKARGLEASIIDNSRIAIGSLDGTDQRSFEIAVAGPAALIVAKSHKIRERVGTNRLEDKDALDVLRILRQVDTVTLSRNLRSLVADGFSREVTEEAIASLRDLFASPAATGSQMAARSVRGLEPPDTIAASCAALVEDLLRAFFET